MQRPFKPHPPAPRLPEPTPSTRGLGTSFPVRSASETRVKMKRPPLDSLRETPSQFSDLLRAPTERRLRLQPRPRLAPGKPTASRSAAAAAAASARARGPGNSRETRRATYNCIGAEQTRKLTLYTAACVPTSSRPRASSRTGARSRTLQVPAA